MHPIVSGRSRYLCRRHVRPGRWQRYRHSPPKMPDLRPPLMRASGFQLRCRVLRDVHPPKWELGRARKFLLLNENPDCKSSPPAQGLVDRGLIGTDQLRAKGPWKLPRSWLSAPPAAIGEMPPACCCRPQDSSLESQLELEGTGADAGSPRPEDARRGPSPPFCGPSANPVFSRVDSRQRAHPCGKYPRNSEPWGDLPSYYARHHPQPRWRLKTRIGEGQTFSELERVANRIGHFLLSEGRRAEKRAGWVSRQEQRPISM